MSRVPTRLPVRWLALILTGLVLSASSAVAGAAQNEDAVYDPDPVHLWNRLYETLFVRVGVDGNKYGVDELDALFWSDTEHLLTEPSHHQALAILDEFLNTHGERLIHDPLKRALLQRDLWALFDWSASLAYDWKFIPERKELQRRLALAIRRLALTGSEIASLPDNYAKAETSNLLTNLPQGLFETNSDWIGVGMSDGEPAAKQHVASFGGLSVFLEFVRMPEGRSAALSYFERLRMVEHPWIYKTESALIEPGGLRRQISVSRPLDLPQFPTNTQWALVRRMCVIDTGGHIQVTSLTESIQVRRYRDVPLESTYHSAPQNVFDQAQQSAEFVMSRKQGGPLRAIADGEKGFRQFMSIGGDPFEEHVYGPPLHATQREILKSCSGCHFGSGIYSVATYNERFSVMPPELVEVSPKREAETTINRKRSQYSWGLLQGLWSWTN